MQNNIRNIVALISLVAMLPIAALASSCSTYGNTTYCDDGTSYSQYGNTVYGSDGTSYSTYGNTTYGSNGSSCSTYGNTTYCNDGTSYSQYGNTTYGSDGSSYSQYGNTTYGTGGTGGGGIFTSCPANSSYDSLTSKCKCKSGYVVSGSKCVYDYSFDDYDYDSSSYYPYPTTPTCPLNAYSDGTSCKCNYGYVADGSQCITVTKSCQNEYGINSYGSGSYCYCSTGYQFNTAGTMCVPLPEAIKTNILPTVPTYSAQIEIEDSREIEPVANVMPEAIGVKYTEPTHAAATQKPLLYQPQNASDRPRPLSWLWGKITSWFGNYL